jgi:geranylgeranyl diphosphate synthase, type II
MEALNSFMEKNIKLVETELTKYISRLEGPDVIKKAMDYSLQAGGKRIRPILLLATIAAFQEEIEKGLAAACSLEMVHTYSLIHDDLPAMDDDDLRRGKPTNHKVYGEAMAILAGDGLLTYSFQVLAEDTRLTNDQKVKLVSLLAKLSGPEGMVGGQVADMEGENRKLTLSELESIHLNKTGKLLTYSVLAGAIIGGASPCQLEEFEIFARNLGIAFQIRDDILDIEGDQAIMGKPIGSDVTNHKSTYPSLLNMQGAKDKLRSHIQKAKTALNKIEVNTNLLEQMTDLIAIRDN